MYFAYGTIFEDNSPSRRQRSGARFFSSGITMTTDSHSDFKSIQEKLSGRISRLVRNTTGCYSYDAEMMAKEIHTIIGDISNSLLNDAPDVALQVADLLLKCDGVLLYSVDDSSGMVAAEFKTLPLIWITAAENAGHSTEYLVSLLRELTEVDDFGFRGEVVRRCPHLIGTEDIHSLADEFREALLREKAAESESDEFFFDQRTITHYATMMMHCAVACNDPVLFEEGATLQFSRDPVGRQALDVTTMYLATGQVSVAKDRLLKFDFSPFEQERDLLEKELNLYREKK